MKRSIVILLVLVMAMSVLSACAPKKDEDKGVAKEVDIKEVHSKIKEELGEDYLPEEEVDLDMITDISGIKAEDVEESILEWPMMTMNIDRFIAIKAKEGKGDAIEEGLNEYKRHMIEDEFKYPMNLPKVNASKVVRQGDYVFYLVLGANDDNMEDAEGKEALEFAEKEVDKVVAIIDGFFK